jgi:ATP-dependent DNA helicase HFM1/MER3
MKPNERGSFREFNKSPFIKLPIKENIITFAHKVSLIIQIHLGGVDLPMGKEFNIIKRQFQSEKVIIFERMLRLIRCVVECKAYECDGVATCNALELLRSVAAGYWENSTLQLRQLPTIGPAAVRKLVQSNVKTIGQLAAMDSAAIERVMSRNPPFGKKILDVVTNFPRLTIQADIKKMIVKAGEPTKLQVKAQVGFLNARFPVWNRKVPTVTFTAYISDGNLAHIWRGPLKRLEKGFDLTFTCELSQPSDIIFCQLACEEIVGTIQSVELKPEIPASSFPSSKPIIPLIEIAPNTVADKVLLSTEEEAEIFALLEEEDYIANAGPRSDYGRDSVFDDFVNIDDLEVGASGENGGPEAKISEPVQMENGKWRCNHKCRDAQGIYLTKNGVPCKHLCCHEGLDRPRKIQKKRVCWTASLSVLILTGPAD